MKDSFLSLLPSQKKILYWYRKQARDIPWRKIRDAYHILVSEVMLQQTQTERVIHAYQTFIKKYPTLRSLAASTKREVILAWQGMGYNRRALYLREAARIIQSQYKGKVPATIDELERLRGIGKYTSRAILCFAYNVRVPVIDVNARRVLSRIFWRMSTPNDVRSEKDIWIIAEKILPKRIYYDWNQAVMDFGASICIANNPKCSQCVIQNSCKSYHTLRRSKNHRRVKTFNTIVPRRIYRGKVVELLRNTPRKSRLSFRHIGQSLRADFNQSYIHWLIDILHTLETDGLIVSYYRGRKINRITSSRDVGYLSFSLAE